MVRLVDNYHFEGNDCVFQVLDTHTESITIKNDVDRYADPIYTELDNLNV